MKKERFRRIFWLEIAVLVASIVLCILPLKFNIEVGQISPAMAINIYYLISGIAVLSAQVAYMWPIGRFRPTNMLAYIGGMILVLLLMLFWFCRIEGRLVDFAHLYRGDLFGPIVFALAVPAIQGFVHILAALGPSD